MLRHLASSAICILALQPLAHAGEGDLVARLREPWSGYFGGVESVVHIEASSTGPAKCTAAWTVSVEGRVIDRGEAALNIDAATPGVIKVALRLPEVKPGVVIPAQLNLSITKEGSAKPATSLEHPLWVYPKDAFADRMVWLEKLQIVLFDPEGATTKVLEAAKVPFNSIKNVDSLAEIREGIVVIGEGISFKDHRSLPAIMAKLAQSGVPVLCLAPKEGEFPLPGSAGNEMPIPTDLNFRRSGAISDLDKRLDSIAWPPDGELLASRIQLQGDRSGVMATLSTGADGWPWIEFRFGRRSLLVCGFAIVEKWEAGPTPRFLFVRLLEELTKDGKK